MTLKAFLKECGEKEVLKKLSVYIVSSWVLIQVLAVTWQPLGLPEKSVTFLIIVLLIAFPLYIFLIWKTSLSQLESNTPRVSKKGKVKRSGFQKMYYTVLMIISLLSVFAIILIINNNFRQNIKLQTSESSDKIGVLNFGNNTGDEKFDVVGKMSADWITHGITENKLAQVVSTEIVNDYMGIITASESETDDQDVLKKYFKPAKVILGNFYSAGEKLIFQCSITDGEINETLISFKPVECDKENPLECIESLKQVILGYLITEDQQLLNLQEFPPKYEAYQYLLDAKSNFSDNDLYIELLNKAIDEDSNYFEPKVLKIAHYYNLGEFKLADSLRLAIQPSSRISERQRNLLNHYKALIAGNNAAIYSTIKKEYNLAPFDLYSNSSTMVVAQQYVNRPQDVDTIFTKISMTNMDVVNCTYCQFRYYTQGLTQLELKKYEEVIALLTLVTEKVNKLYLKRPIIAAYIRSNNIHGLEEYCRAQELVSSKEELIEMYLFAGKEFLLKNKKMYASDYFSKIMDEKMSPENTSSLSEIAYYKEDYELAEKLFKREYDDNSGNEKVLSRLAVAYYKNGKREDAGKIISELNSLRSDYKYGSIDYSLAQFYAATNDKENAMKYLLKAVAAGLKYKNQTFQNDPHFNEYRETIRFKNIMTYWH